MRYLKKFNESLYNSDLINDIKDLNYELSDLGISMRIKPDPDLDSEFEVDEIGIILWGEYSKFSESECYSFMRILTHLDLILNQYGLTSNKNWPVNKITDINKIISNQIIIKGK